MNSDQSVWTVALVGNPNSGKTALFNAMTGGRAKVGNYPGVTVERRLGIAEFADGRPLEILDLPGTYSLDSRTLDESITRDALLGGQAGGDPSRPDAVCAVVDATQLQRGLGLVLELKDLEIPFVLVLNMVDLARKRGQILDVAALSKALGVPVLETVAPTGEGIRELFAALADFKSGHSGRAPAPRPGDVRSPVKPLAGEDEIRRRFARVDEILAQVLKVPPKSHEWTHRIDRVILHPLWGSLLLLALLALVFQALFTWSKIPMDGLKELVDGLGHWVEAGMDAGPLRSLLVDGVLAGVGSVVVFLPQILLLFSFILFLEDSGYMARAAFLMDRLMGRVGLHGRAFIPLLSSFACAIPGVMATRTIENRRDRLTTILVAPLMTCSARLPVYSLLIGAFIPNVPVFWGVRLQGLVMLGLYLAGVAAALLMAVLFRRTLFRGPTPPLLMELPTYKWPSLKSIVLGLFERARLFIQRAGTVILALSIVIWFLVSYPKPPVGWGAQSGEPPITYSYAGKVGKALEPLVAPLGFNWKIAVALIPGFAAREVMIGALATVYSVENAGQVGSDEDEAALGKKLSTKIEKDWSLATALSLLVWYVLACQCLSTLAVVRRETATWRWPAFLLAYMTCLAYVGSWLTYRGAVWLGWG